MSEHEVMPAPGDERFVSRLSAERLARTLQTSLEGGGTVDLNLESRWIQSLVFGGNAVVSISEVSENVLSIVRNIRGNAAQTHINETDTQSLIDALRRTERLIRLNPERLERISRTLPPEEHSEPDIWSESTYNLDLDELSGAVAKAVRRARENNLVTAGIAQVAAYGDAHIRQGERLLYYPHTKAEFSVGFKTDDGMASGWAGVDHSSWSSIDVDRIVTRAFEKCLAARNPVLVEPGRYTVVLEPQAVADYFSPTFNSSAMVRRFAEDRASISPFTLGNGDSKIGLKVFDHRFTLTSDPADPDMGAPPFDRSGAAYHKAVWVENGVLRNLAYDRPYAVENLGSNSGLLINGSYKIHGTDTSLNEMIASTRRGLLVTRFSNVQITDLQSLMTTGFTRDGLWLITNGRVESAVRNFRFNDSPLISFNAIDMIGMEERVYNPYAPVIAPAVKVVDFSMVSISHSV